MIEVPDELWKEIKAVLDARRFIDLGDDTDNDYEVIHVLDEMNKLKGS